MLYTTKMGYVEGIPTHSQAKPNYSLYRGPKVTTNEHMVTDMIPKVQIG